ncbi:hypothetical protein HNO88_004133 [Novosphingobium chloroacetimidivorans]|uniref:Uncharacterized protein n=1 Tax=Novosphingobium chloroacetimidivorans TaxID=1428314 RepID=A0A7W7KEL3_9SPHN|nr:hypothetical protein [Novosphingobium chloroacetimidivorans]
MYFSPGSKARLAVTILRSSARFIVTVMTWW